TEVGPERVGEMDLRVGELPEQEVRDAELSAGTHHELQRRQALRPEPVLDRPRVDGAGVEAVGGDPARHRDDFLATSVAERARELPDRVASPAVSFQPGQPSLLRPAAVSIHDDADMARERALRDFRLELGDVPFDTRHEVAGTIAGMLRGASFGLGYLPCAAGSAHFASSARSAAAALAPSTARSIAGRASPSP